MGLFVHQRIRHKLEEDRQKAKAAAENVGDNPDNNEDSGKAETLIPDLNLEKLNTSELRKLAKENNIDLSGAGRKPDIISRILDTLPIADTNAALDGNDSENSIIENGGGEPSPHSNGGELTGNEEQNNEADIGTA